MSEAGAAAFNVEARTEAQAYEIRAYRGTTPTDITLLPRRRVVQYLGLDAFELVTGQDLGFESNLRIYSDFGLPRGEANLIDGLRTEDVDLLYANVRYRNSGFEGVLGRQYFIDINDIFSIDGLRARYVSRFGIGAEAYAGLWVKSASVLGTSNTALDGTRELEKPATPEQLARDPLFEEANSNEPVYGARLIGQNVLGSGISGAFGYRRSTIDNKTSSERLGAELQYGKGRGINAISALEYDLMIGRVSSVRALARYDAALFAAQVEALRFAPTFSAYSLWYYFATAARDELRVRGDFTPVGPLRYYGQLSAAHYGLNVSDAIGLSNVVQSGNSGTGMVYGASGGAALAWRQFRSAADVSWRNGWGGRQVWVDVTGGYQAPGARWSVDGRFSFAHVRDQYNTLLRGSFYGGQLWGRYQLTKSASASVAVEENINPFTQNDTRVYLVIDIKVL